MLYKNINILKHQTWRSNQWLQYFVWIYCILNCVQLASIVDMIHRNMKVVLKICANARYLIALTKVTEYLLICHICRIKLVLCIFLKLLALVCDGGWNNFLNKWKWTTFQQMFFMPSYWHQMYICVEELTKDFLRVVNLYFYWVILMFRKNVKVTWISSS